MYEYMAYVRKVYDGDTITVDIDLGFGIVMKAQKIRLLYIDTPEIRGESREEGLKSRDALRQMIGNKWVKIKTYRDSKGKYGRWLGEVFIDKDDSLVNINEWLVSEGLAKKLD